MKSTKRWLMCLLIIAQIFGSVSFQGLMAQAAEKKAGVTIAGNIRYMVLRVGESRKVSVKRKKKDSHVVYLAGRKGKSRFLTVSKKGVIRAKKCGVGKSVRVYVGTEDKKRQDYVVVKILPKIHPGKKMVALTFDDGPDTVYTTRIARCLEKHNAAGTFFLLGSRLGSRSTRRKVQWMDRQGMEIASHTQNHKRLTAISASALREEIHHTDLILKKIIGEKPDLVRTPYGAYNSAVLKAINRPMILWSVDTLDWKYRNADTIYRRTMSQVKDGSIVLMHSIYGSTAKAVERLVPALQKKGYQLVTVSELYQYKGRKLKKCKVYTHS